MAVEIEIRRASQLPASYKGRAKRATVENVIIQIPNRGLMRADLLDNPVRVAIAVKVAYDSTTIEHRCWRRCWCGCWRIYQVVTNDIEVDAFRRCRGDVQKLASTNERILNIRMCLRARIAQPIPQIAARVLIETENIGHATVDGEITRA